MALTVKRVQRALRKGERVMPSDKGGTRGLYLAVHSKTSAHWAARFQLNGRARLMGLGSARDFDLSEARKRAREARQKLADGIDPLDAKRSERAVRRATALKVMTFRQCAELYIKENRAKWRNAKHGMQWSTSLATSAFPLIGDLPVGDIDTPIVLRVLRQPVDGQPFWQARTETASRVRGRVESVLA